MCVTNVQSAIDLAFRGAVGMQLCMSVASMNKSDVQVQSVIDITEQMSFKK